MKRALFVVALFVVVLLAAACGTTPATSRPATSGPPRFRVDLYAERIGVVYDYADIEHAVDAAIAGRRPVASLDERDVETLRIPPTHATVLDLVLTPSASDRLRAPLSHLVETQALVASLDGHRLWVGVAYTPQGQAAIGCPILDDSPPPPTGPITLHLEEHMGADFLGPHTSPTPTRIDADAFRALFTSRDAVATM